MGIEAGELNASPILIGFERFATVAFLVSFAPPLQSKRISQNVSSKERLPTLPTAKQLIDISSIIKQSEPDLILEKPLSNPAREIDVVVIGGGQSALATAYFLRRAEIDYVVLDEQPAAGGAWRHAWDSLHLFSPAQWSSLPGWMMPATTDAYPPRDHVVRYLAEYEKRYWIPAQRPVRVTSVSSNDSRLLVTTDTGTWLAKAVVSATGGFDGNEPPAPLDSSPSVCVHGIHVHAMGWTQLLPTHGRLPPRRLVLTDTVEIPLPRN